MIVTCQGCGKRRRTKPGTPIVCQCYVPGTKQFKARMKSVNQVRTDHGLEPVSVRYRMIQDESCHWYVIRTDQVQEFEQWQDAMSECIDRDGFDFNEVRVNGPHDVTFPEWKEESS